MTYDAWETIFYFPEDNMFTDSCGMPIHNMLELITVNDLYLFRKGIRQEFTLLSHHRIGVVIVGQDDDYLEYVDGEGIFIKQ